MLFTPCFFSGLYYAQQLREELGESPSRGLCSAQVYMHTDQDFPGYAPDGLFHGAAPPLRKLRLCRTLVAAK